MINITQNPATKLIEAVVAKSQLTTVAPDYSPPQRH